MTHDTIGGFWTIGRKWGNCWLQFIENWIAKKKWKLTIRSLLDAGWGVHVWSHSNYKWVQVSLSLILVSPFFSINFFFYIHFPLSLKKKRKSCVALYTKGQIPERHSVRAKVFLLPKRRTKKNYLYLFQNVTLLFQLYIQFYIVNSNRYSPSSWLSRYIRIIRLMKIVKQVRQVI